MNHPAETPMFGGVPSVSRTCERDMPVISMCALRESSVVTFASASGVGLAKAGSGATLSLIGVASASAVGASVGAGAGADDFRR
jgi:hypothetical protein